MIIEKILETYDNVEFSTNIFRASLAGKCPRRLAFQHFGYKGEVSLRGTLVLEHGEKIHDLIKKRIKLSYDQGLLDRIENLVIEGIDQDLIELELDLGDGVKLTGHPDATCEHVFYGPGVLEIKSASNYVFRKAMQGIVDPEYLAQGAVYVYSGKFDFITWIFYRKETSHLVEITLVKDDKFMSQVYMQRPEKRIVVIEDIFNFDFNLVKEKYQKILSLKDPFESLKVFPEPVNHWACTNCSGTGISPAGGKKCRRCQGSGVDPEPGLRYPCSYCPYFIYCYPDAILEWDSEFKPIIKIKKEG